jgi:hypothetical protein
MRSTTCIVGEIWSCSIDMYIRRQVVKRGHERGRGRGILYKTERMLHMQKVKDRVERENGRYMY